jgi:glycogen debranching enzyme
MSQSESFEPLGRAIPGDLERAPDIPAEAAGDLLVVKEGGIFACSRPDGDIRAGSTPGQGLYSSDTRFLSELRLTIGGRPLVLLSSSADEGHKAVVDLTNPHIDGDVHAVSQMTLNIRRIRLIAKRMHEAIIVTNHGRETAETTLELRLGADFLDIFEVRGVRHRVTRGQVRAPNVENNGVRFAYEGQDGLLRETIVGFSPAPEIIEVEDGSVEVSWNLEVPWRARTRIEMTIEPTDGEKRAPALTFSAAETAAEEHASTWASSCTGITSSQTSFDRLINASVRDLRLLGTNSSDGEIVAAGIPWYVAPFGRDTLLTCYEMLLLNPNKARNTLLYLAHHQATEDDPGRDAEPGKILHELRNGELARARLIAHTPYYGSVDSTPLFLMLAGSYHRWTSDTATIEAIMPSIEAALNWIDKHGDQDGDGFVEYKRRSPGGLDNHGWKDSEDSIVDADGRIAEGPIALVEVQGYVYLAKLRTSEVFDALGRGDEANELRAAANDLKERFNDAFWMPDEGTYALALDGRKRQVGSVTSNPGHCLYTGIVDRDKAKSTAERLMATDMFSGWGIRTLSAENPAYNPMSYHTGSIWPHDNAITAAGLKRYNCEDATARIATVLYEAALEDGETRLPELYCGFRRRSDAPFVRYPVACRPQAWAAAVPFMLLQAMLGLSAEAPDNTLSVYRPHLPDWLSRVELRNLRVGSSEVSLAFDRTGATTSLSLIERAGDLRVAIKG